MDDHERAAMEAEFAKHDPNVWTKHSLFEMAWKAARSYQSPSIELCKETYTNLEGEALYCNLPREYHNSTTHPFVPLPE